MSILNNFNFNSDIKFNMSEIISAMTHARYISTIDDKDNAFRWYFLESIHWTPALEDTLFLGLVECVKITPSNKNLNWWNIVIKLKISSKLFDKSEQKLSNGFVTVLRISHQGFFLS